MKLFLDDERPTPDGWERAYTAKVNCLFAPFTQHNGHPVSVNRRTQEYMATLTCHLHIADEYFAD